MTTPTTAALARGLFALDQHRWNVGGDFESLRPHYERDAERFLLPALTDVRAVGAAEFEETK